GPSLTGLAIMFGRRTLSLTGAFLPASFAILRVYFSVTLSAVPCAFAAFKSNPRIRLSKPFTLTFIFVTLSHALYTRYDSVPLCPFYLRLISRTSYRQITPS